MKGMDRQFVHSLTNIKPLHLITEHVCTHTYDKVSQTKIEVFALIKTQNDIQTQKQMLDTLEILKVLNLTFWIS